MMETNPRVSWLRESFYRHVGTSHLVQALEFLAEKMIPGRWFNSLEAGATYECGIVNQQVNRSELSDCGLNDYVSILEERVVCNRCTAGIADLVDYSSCRFLK
jgi:hypothetical protein